MSTVVNLSCTTTDNKKIQWDQLAVIPDSTGFAGSFAGISNGSLLVAGGANFPDNGRPWSGGVKTWYDKIFVLEDEDGQWKEAGKLPRSMGYGVSLTWKDGMLIFGGADKDRHYAESYFIRYINGGIVTEQLPSMPLPTANAAGAIINDTVYIAGGQSAPTDTATRKEFWCLDLSTSAANRSWKQLESWPGPSRMLAVAGVMNNEFYLVSGVTLAVTPGDSVAHREYLKDAYRFDPRKGWKKIADLPNPTVAAPSPALSVPGTGLLVIGGDDGSRADSNTILKDKHPGFTKRVLVFNDNKWSTIAEVLTIAMPDPENNPNGSTWAPVTTPMLLWNGAIVIPGGEVRPGVRTNRVLRASLNVY